MGGRVFALAFVIFWSVCTIGFDRHFGATIARQVRALTYPTATATILESRIDERERSTRRGGRSYLPVVRYRYEFAGAVHESGQWRYGAERTNMKRDSTRVVGRFPVGATVPVRVNPRDPADAVLVAGIQGLDAFMLLFMTPFNAVMVGGWFFAGATLLGAGPARPSPLGDVRVWEAGGVTRAALEGAWLPLVAGLAALFVLSIPAALAVAFGFGFNGPVAAPLTAIGLVLGMGAIGFQRTRAAQLRGDHDLLLDDTRRVLTLPRSVEKGAQRELPYAAIVNFGVELVPSKGPDDDPTWNVMLRAAGDRSWKILTCSQMARAEALAGWLNERIGPTSARAVAA